MKYSYLFLSIYALLSLTSCGHSIENKEDLVEFLEEAKIESFDEYNHYYSDSSLGMSISELHISFSNNQVTYGNATPTSYTIESHLGGDRVSNDSYYTLDFYPDKLNGDMVRMFVCNDDKNNFSNLWIESKVFDSESEPNKRRMISGPTFKKQ
ncbi:MAG: hypothetical protein COB15_08855 [Flavobacteriales bacterium]|nr:MAG: hypothetical protein COB15_08855 [Flavobacteriales bacterium]